MPWQSTGGSSQRCPGFDSQQLPSFSLSSIFASYSDQKWQDCHFCLFYNQPMLDGNGLGLDNSSVKKFEALFACVLSTIKMCHSQLTLLYKQPAAHYQPDSSIYHHISLSFPHCVTSPCVPRCRSLPSQVTISLCLGTLRSPTGGVCRYGMPPATPEILLPSPFSAHTPGSMTTQRALSGLRIPGVCVCACVCVCVCVCVCTCACVSSYVPLVLQFLCCWLTGHELSYLLPALHPWVPLRHSGCPPYCPGCLFLPIPLAQCEALSFLPCSLKQYTLHSHFCSKNYRTLFFATHVLPKLVQLVCLY